jgi:hypothetical protein
VRAAHAAAILLQRREDLAAAAAQIEDTQPRIARQRADRVEDRADDEVLGHRESLRVVGGSTIVEAPFTS